MRIFNYLMSEMFDQNAANAVKKRAHRHKMSLNSTQQQNILHKKYGGRNVRIKK